MPSAPVIARIKDAAHAVLRRSGWIGYVAGVATFGIGMISSSEHGALDFEGTPAEREAEMKSLDAGLQHINDMKGELELLKDTGWKLYHFENDASLLRRDLNGPPLKVSYDTAWLKQTEDRLDKDIKDATVAAEMVVIHSRHLSGNDFVKYANELAGESGPRGYGEILLSFQNSEFKFVPLHMLRSCQKEIAMKDGSARTEKTARDIATCTGETTDRNLSELAGGSVGLWVLGLAGRSLRKKWEKAAGTPSNVTDEAPPPDPDAPPASPIHTSQDIKVKPIKLVMKAGA